MTVYTTRDGDTWDSIAYGAYGDCYAFEAIMDANPSHIDTLVFSNGVELELPEDPGNVAEVSSDYPAWRAELNDGD